MAPGASLYADRICRLMLHLFHRFPFMHFSLCETSKELGFKGNRKSLCNCTPVFVGWIFREKFVFPIEIYNIHEDHCQYTRMT